MKVGEALTLRSQLQTRFQLLRERLKASAMVQEGENPPEDPTALLTELEGVAAELELSALHQVAETASAAQTRYGRAELRIVRTVDVGALRVRADELAKERRELDATIQEANWQTELVD
jgi:hypothetical protein